MASESGFARPTLPELIANIRADLNARFENDEILRRQDREVYARVQSAAVHTLYGYIDYLARNLLPDLCDEDWLVRHAKLKRVTRKPAVQANGLVRFNDVTPGAEIKAGTVIERPADGYEYTTTATVKATGSELRVPVNAVTPGAAGNCDDEEVLYLVDPVSGVPSACAAESLSNGIDAEDVEAWRARIIERWYWTPQSGADHDYETWAKEVPGITKAWTKRSILGPGTIAVIVATAEPDHPAPSSILAEQVKEYIVPRAPVAGSGLFVIPVTERSIHLTINLRPDNAKNRAAVTAEIKSFLYREGEPSKTIEISRLSEAVSSATGEYAHKIIEPTENPKMGEFEHAKLGELIWQAAKR